MYNLGLVGNCQVSVLVSINAKVEWLCMPQVDSPPVFGCLLDRDGGQLTTVLEGETKSKQQYIKNTNILATFLTNDNGDSLKILDFCPRFFQHGRMFRPPAFYRIIYPESGSPKIKIGVDPVLGWTKQKPTRLRGNAHIDFTYPEGYLRVTTNAPLTYVLEDQSFKIHEPVVLAVHWNHPLEADLHLVATDFLLRTEEYWRTWVKHCSIPTLFQEETIRSALALKLHCFEDTGAIVASPTTSLPEIIGGQRNWDYRLCWIRDAFFTLSSFHNLGHFEEMEGFLKYILNVVEPEKKLSPVYAINPKVPIPEVIHENWSGYEGSFPVRSGNAAHFQDQFDVYGELLLALTPIFRDERFYHLRTPDLEDMILWLAQMACESIGKKDAGIWELRTFRLEHSFTNIMCLAGLRRVLKIIETGQVGNKLTSHRELFAAHALRAEKRLLAATKDGVLCNSPDDHSLDASMLFWPILKLCDLEKGLKTVKAIHENLGYRDKNSGALTDLIFRYKREDDFGAPEVPFVICSFWLAGAYASLGLKDKGLEILKSLLPSANTVGLYSEHFDPRSQRQLGNFPQAYSHVGLVNAAFGVSPQWSEVL